MNLTLNKNLAIIGASYLQLPLILKAKEMGYVTHVFAWRANDVGEQAADYFYPISITEIDEITNQCKSIGIEGICSIATDLGNYTVNIVANRLGLSGNSIDCTLKSTNKYMMRKTFESCSDPIPKFLLVDGNIKVNELDIPFPVIVKPTDRSGSRGIYKIDNMDMLPFAVRKAIDESFEKKALIEEFIEGQEYSVEGISFKGKHHILAMTLKHTTGAPYFIETGHIEPAPVSDEIFEKVKKIVLHALDSLGIQNSASHSEVKIDSHNNVRIIEIGSRMGGDCIGSDLVRISTGIDYVKAVIQVSCGIEPDLTPIEHGQFAEVKFILNRNDLNEFIRLKKEEPETIIRIVDDKHFDLIGRTTDSSNRAGCYIIRKREYNFS